MVGEVGQAFARRVYERLRARWNPPEHYEDVVDPLEPFGSSAQDGCVQAIVGVMLERRERLPDRQVDQDPFVFEGADARGVTAVRLQAPHETRRPIRGGIDMFQLGDELCEAGVIKRCSQAANIGLSELVAGRHRKSIERAVSKDKVIYIVLYKEPEDLRP